MNRFFLIMLLTFIAALVISCEPPEEKPIWEQVKLSDVASTSSDHTTGQLLKTINLDIHTFEVPAEKIGDLNDLWQALYVKPLRFNDSEAFSANSFLIGFGQIQMWDKIAFMLRSAGGQKGETVSLIIPDGQTSDFTVARLGKNQTVFYFSAVDLMESETIGPGKLVLRIKVGKIPGSRGVCSVNAQPVLTTSIHTSVPQLADQAKSAEISFDSAGFSLKMSTGDFVLLGPERYIDNQITLDSLFFSRPGRIPTVRILLIICTRIVD